MVTHHPSYPSQYINATYEKWQWKTHPKYAAPEKIRDEIILMASGIWTSVFLPTISLNLTQRGLSEGYCGVGDHGWSYLVGSFLLVVGISDFVEWFLHWSSHKWEAGWKVHKAHHLMFNPSPFAVVADRAPDQFIRALPLAIFPMLMPINMDMLFGTFAVFFYAYGLYLHCGHEFPWPGAHHSWINTSFQHYIHHAGGRNPQHSGFFFKIWDNLVGATYKDQEDPKKCLCVEHCKLRGERTREAWEKVVMPDYSTLLSPSFFIKGLPIIFSGGGPTEQKDL